MLYLSLFYTLFAKLHCSRFFLSKVEEAVLRELKQVNRVMGEKPRKVLLCQCLLACSPLSGVCHVGVFVTDSCCSGEQPPGKTVRHFGICTHCQGGTGFTCAHTQFFRIGLIAKAFSPRIKRQETEDL